MIMPPFQHPDIAAIYESYPSDIRKQCLLLRTLIFDVANEYQVIGPIEETLRWGEPSYIPSTTKSGSMVRLHHYASKPFDAESDKVTPTQGQILTVGSIYRLRV